MANKQNYLALLWISVVVVILDLVTKHFASSNLTYAQPVEILPLLNFTLLHNTGAAFSFLSEAGGWQRWFFIGITVVVTVALLVWLYTLNRYERITAFGIVLIIGGALGNLYDRVTLGYVVDFIQVHWFGQAYFPAFNIADSAICIGTGLLLLELFLPKKQEVAH